MNKEKIIFLDFDGPLTNGRTHAAYGDDGMWKRPDPVAIQFLNRLVEKTQAKIVLSTSWAMTSLNPANLVDGYEDLREWLTKKHGLIAEFHEDYMTPRKMSSSRATEISWWLTKHPEVKVWVAIDDEYLSSSFGINAVVVHPNDGMSLSNYQHALKVLNEESI